MKRATVIVLCLIAGLAHGQAQRAFVDALYANQPTAETSTDWWRSGGVSAASVVAVYVPKGAASLAASYTNVASPGTHTLTVGAAPTLAAAGWVFPNNKWLITDIAPSGDYTIICRFTNVTATLNTDALLGVRNGSVYYAIYPNGGTGAGAVIYENGSAVGGNVAPALFHGVLAMAGTKAYRNGVDEGATLTTSTGNTLPLFIGCRNENGSSRVLYLDGTIQVVAIYSAALTGAQVLAITQEMLDL